jgi:hypothetical protein
MSDNGSSVTLILYKIGDQWWKEPALNLLAAAAQFSSYTHVEIAIGECAGDGGQMANVARIYNDAVGVEVCQRTGKNPCYTYLSIGCSQGQVNRMLQFARAQVGKPFSNAGMARSIMFPRQSSYRTFFCAELVGAILKHGGLMYALCSLEPSDVSRTRLFFCTRTHALFLEELNGQCVEVAALSPTPQPVFVVYDADLCILLCFPTAQS